MVQPTAFVELGSQASVTLPTDISSRVKAPVGAQPSIRWWRGVNFDGSAQAPGGAVVIVNNQDRAFNPQNASSPYYTRLRINTGVRLYATHPDYQWSISSSSAADERVTTSAAHGLVVGDMVTISGHSGSTPSLNRIWHVLAVPTTTTVTLFAWDTGNLNITTGGTGGTITKHLPQFYGALRRIVPRDDGYAELHCQDSLYFAQRDRALVETDMGKAEPELSILDIREQIAPGAFSNLSTAGPELNPPHAISVNTDALSELTEMNRATGTVHWMQPYRYSDSYTTRAFSHFKTADSVETWTDADLALPFATALQRYDYSDEGVINKQTVIATDWIEDAAASDLWDWGEQFEIEPGEEVHFWVNLGGVPKPLTQTLTATEVGDGGINAIATIYGDVLSLVVTGTGSKSTLVTQLTYNAVAHRLTTQREVTVEDTTSQATYGVLAGADISSKWIVHRGAARELADYIIWRHAEPRTRVSIDFSDRWPTQLLRDVTDIVTVTSTELSLSAVRMTIVSLEGAIQAGVWSMHYELEDIPAGVSVGVYDTALYDTDAYG